VIEHESISVRFIVDRGVSHELVRHRLCAFSQESTRYCNYKGGMTFVIPPWLPLLNLDEGKFECFKFPDNRSAGENEWLSSMMDIENRYLALLADHKWTPQQARTVLPNSLKTEIVMTTNLREWRHVLKLRTSHAAHPQMREIMVPLLEDLVITLPEIFGDILVNLKNKKI